MILIISVESIEIKVHKSLINELKSKTKKNKFSRHPYFKVVRFGISKFHKLHFLEISTIISIVD